MYVIYKYKMGGGDFNLKTEKDLAYFKFPRCGVMYNFFSLI